MGGGEEGIFPIPHPHLQGNPRGLQEATLFPKEVTWHSPNMTSPARALPPLEAPWGKHLGEPFSNLYSLVHVLGLIPRSEGTGPGGRCLKDRLLLSAASTSGTPRATLPSQPPPGETE